MGLLLVKIDYLSLYTSLLLLAMNTSINFDPKAPNYFAEILKYANYTLNGAPTNLNMVQHAYEIICRIIKNNPELVSTTISDMFRDVMKRIVTVFSDHYDTQDYTKMALLGGFVLLKQAKPVKQVKQSKAKQVEQVNSDICHVLTQHPLEYISLPLKVQLSKPVMDTMMKMRSSGKLWGMEPVLNEISVMLQVLGNRYVFKQ